MTRPCWREPPSGSFSQKQPPACSSRLRFWAEPDQVCSGSHHADTLPNAAYTAAGAARVVATDSMVKLDSRLSSTPAGTPSVTAPSNAETISHFVFLMRVSLASGFRASASARRTGQLAELSHPRWGEHLISACA